MSRRFNTAGACTPGDHYTIPTWRRLPLTGLIEQKAYFVVHAPRQVGKTTFFQNLAKELTAGGQYTAVLVSMITGADQVEDVGTAELAILNSWRRTASVDLPPDRQPPPWPDAPPRSRIGAALDAWARAIAPGKLVVFLDEIDALRDGVLLSVLRQLQDGHRHRPVAFPWSLALIGLRDVRDYRIATADGSRGSPSPFNIVQQSITVAPFTLAEVSELYDQHTAETGQRFEPASVRRVFDLTQGQPWLVNALAKEIVGGVAPDPAIPITPDHVDQAKDMLIRGWHTHIDHLGERLEEPRVKAVIEPLLVGTTLTGVRNDDIKYAIDLGLVRMGEKGGGIEPANPFYREVIVEQLAFSTRATLPRIKSTWQKPDGRIDLKGLLDAFLLFWRQHGGPLLASASYHEVAPHLVLMAFLYRVVDAGGSIEREYAIGSGRMDLFLRHGSDRMGIELKVWRNERPDPVHEGLEQLDRYLAGLALERGWLVIFDQRSGQVPLEERVSLEHATTAGGRFVEVIRA